jgi:hypothetical protein
MVPRDVLFPRLFLLGSREEVVDMWIWTLVVVGYVAPGLVSGLALRPAADTFKRWGRATTSVS